MRSAGPGWAHPKFFGQTAAARLSLQLMIPVLRLFSKRHSTASKALASAFDRRHPVRPKYGTRPLGLSCVIRPGLSRQRAAPSRERFREIAAFAFNGDLQRNTSRDMGPYRYSVSKCN